MLMSGRWLLIILIFSLSAGFAQAATPSSAKAKAAAREEAIAQEQSRAFGLSVSPRLLPNQAWFSGRDQESQEDVMARRWVKDPHVIRTTTTRK